MNAFNHPVWHSSRDTKLQRQLDRIVRYVSERCEIGVLDVRSESRRQHICQVRYMIIYLARNLTSTTWMGAARAVGRSDHSTAKNAYAQASRLLRESQHHRQMMDEFRKELSEEFMG